MKVLIVGSGFGGLALAAYLQKDGHDVTIIEKKPDRPQAGFVIGLWRNGIHTLEPFGVVERIEQLSIPITEEIIRNQTGKMIARMDYQPLIEHYGPVFLLLHSDLHTVLREMTTAIPIHFETRVLTLKEQQQGVSVTLSDGSQDEFDLVVGADGIHSQVRRLLFGDEGLTPSDMRIWFSLLPARKEMPSEPNDLFGEGTYVGVFPTRGKQVGVLFLASLPAGELEPPEGWVAYLQERFGSFGWLVPMLLQSLHDPATLVSDRIDQVTLETWYRGRVALLGDAAHAVSPTTAMGGAMALEDAHVLAEELCQVKAVNVEEALARYVVRRKPRIAQLQQTSHLLLWVASIDQPIVAFIRNAVMHLLPSEMLIQGMEPMLKTLA